MNPSQANSRERLRRSIDAEIKSLEESIKVLKYRRNALSPISSLHPELFAAIFSIVCLPGKSSQDGKPNDYNLVRLRISHVCHQWRETALNLPLLWSRVDFTSMNLAGAAEALVRAKSAPLYLEANISSQRWDDDRFSTFQNELQAHVPHIRHLKISAKPALLHKTLLGLITPAPTVESLSLSSTGGHRRWRAGRSGRLSIPDTLFDSSAPRLSRLELRNCDIRWSSLLLKGLKHLKIVTVSTNARPDLTVWLAAMEEMPQLTTLTLHSASPIPSPLPLVVKRTATLPFLTHLDMLDYPGDCALVLAHLHLPSLTWLCLTSIFSSHPLIGSDVQKLLPFIVRHAHGPQDTQPLQSVLVYSQEYRADIVAWPVPNIDANVHGLPTLHTEMPPARVVLSFYGDERLSPDACLEIFDMVLARLPLDGLVMLAAHDLNNGRYEEGLDTLHFWRHLSPMWTMLQCV
jgi:hypothetical protein